MTNALWRYPDGVSIDANFPGGNIVVESRSDNTIYLRQDLRDTEGDWFYWYFRVSGAAGEHLEFRFTGSDVVGPLGPACSFGGSAWKWLGSDSRIETGFAVDIPEDAESAGFAMAIPYVMADLERFTARIGTEERVSIETPYHSKDGRPAPVIRIGGAPERSPAHRILITCRNHACESMASYVLEGLIEGVLAPDDTGRWFAEYAEVLAVPMVDIDGVERGDQGKNRRPHDHNRDYGSPVAVHPEVRGLKELVEPWARSGVSVGLDLHCPSIRGEGHERIFFVGGRDESIWREVKRFSAVVETNDDSGLGYAAADNLPFGTSWNTSDSGMLESCSAWMSSLPGIRFGATLEFAYANANGNEVTITRARKFGATIAQALVEYLSDV